MRIVKGGTVLMKGAWRAGVRTGGGGLTDSFGGVGTNVLVITSCWSLLPTSRIGLAQRKVTGSEKVHVAGAACRLAATGD